MSDSVKQEGSCSGQEICYDVRVILYEFEGKELLAQAGIDLPKFELLLPNQKPDLSLPLVFKAQVLSGKRADAGGIIKVDSEDDLESALSGLFGKVVNKEKVEKVLAEELVNFDEEYYISLAYDTDTRCPLLSFSNQGGTGIENKTVDKMTIDILRPNESLQRIQVPDREFYQILEKLLKLFFEQDCLLLEINPLVKAKNGKWVALDAKIKLDDDAKARHEDWQSASWRTPRGVPGYTPTPAEVEAKKIDEGDYRGVAGSTYFDLDGDIAVLSSGGGVSLTALDALLAHGGMPANYTEYSGNPPKEKVVKLAKIVLSKPNLHGLWVIGTVAANFTDIYETLSGVLEGLREAKSQLGKKFDFPIVIRRGGPRDKEAFEMLAKVKDFNLVLQGEEVSIAESAKVMADLAGKYAAS